MEAPDPVACERCVAELRRHGIVSERDFRRWSLRHHPDKQGDEAIYQRVSECKQVRGHEPLFSVSMASQDR